MRQNANFEALGLTPDASWEEVKAAFRRMARLYHPDIAGPDGAQKFTEITDAYMTLKETISTGVSHAPLREPAYQGDSDWSLRGLLREIWSKICSLFGRRRAKEDEEEQSFDDDIPPARVRFIGSAISRAEADLDALLSRRSAVKERSTNDAILRRLRSRHPSVVTLALRRISLKDKSDEIRRMALDHFRRNMPTSEVLECLLSIFSSSDYVDDLAQVLMSHAANFPSGDVIMLISWFKRRKMPVGYFAAFLSNPSDSVIAIALSNWPQNERLPETTEVFNLLKKSDEAILVPLLRLLKKEKLPIWIMPAITKLSRDHKSSAVRVWACAIVRDQNTS
ncbi:MAG: DnaJ domain-containing protein [Synergistaceae bacterium]|nr:DnaJ domain-containing protein [Synergistaceae bacterium]